MHSPLRSRLGPIASALLLGVVAACGAEVEGGEREPSAPTSSAGGADALRLAQREQRPDWAEDNLRRRDPQVDQWPSEVLHDRALEVLTSLLQQACGGKDWERSQRLEILAPSFRGSTDLRPDSLALVFDDGSARVWKPESIAAELHDAARFEGVVRELSSPFQGANCNSFAKIVRVELEGAERFATTAFVHTDGAAAQGGLLQQNMGWELDWVVLPSAADDAAEKARVRIEALRLERYDEVWVERPLFAELEAHVFGGNRSFREELLYGVVDYYGRTDRLLGSEFLGMNGSALGDVNGDGLDDLYLGQPGGLPNRLFLHQPDGTALDATASSQAGLLENTRGVLILDWDNDGDQDLMLAVGPALVTAKNDGRGAFSQFKLWRADSPGDIYSLSAADADGDGDLDVYACRYAENGILFGVPVPYHDADNGNTNVYFRNDGDEFTNATDEVGFGSNNRKFSLASIWEDFDEDGDLDLFVSNDFGRDNLFRNDGGRFSDVAGEVGADDISAGMGASAADFDLDGDQDLYITNMFSAAGRRIVPQGDKFMEGGSAEVRQHYQRHARGNTLLANRGDGTFEDVTDSAGVAVGGWGWGACFVDFNNDGLADLFSPDGFLTNRRADDL